MDSSYYAQASMPIGLNEPYKPRPNFMLLEVVSIHGEHKEWRTIRTHTINEMWTVGGLLHISYYNVQGLSDEIIVRTEIGYLTELLNRG